VTETVFQVETTPIVFGRGAAKETGFHLELLGIRRALLVTDPYVHELGIADRVRSAVAEVGIEAEIHAGIKVEPAEESVLETIAVLRAGGFDGVVGVGGGSSIDTAKIAALVATHDGELLEYVNKPIGEAKPPPGPILPLVAIPTTAGTGSEATGVAILDLPRLGVKTGIAHRYLRPRLGIVDPLLTVSASPEVTASCGIDALCHAVESYTTRPFDSRERSSPGGRPVYQGANPISDAWSLRAIAACGAYLRRAVTDGSDLEARTQMALAATLAGFGFANVGCHIPHACSYPVATLRRAWTPPGYPNASAYVPHGFAVAVTAPACLRFTEPARPERHREVARLLGGGDDLPEAMGSLMRDVGAPTSLRTLGYDEDDVPALAEAALQQQRILVNAPRQPELDDLERIFRESL
jgi:alcohol dehydrogenase class IV